MTSRTGQKLLFGRLFFFSYKPVTADLLFFLTYKPVMANLLWEKNTVPQLISHADKLSRTGKKWSDEVQEVRRAVPQKNEWWSARGASPSHLLHLSPHTIFFKKKYHRHHLRCTIAAQALTPILTHCGPILNSLVLKISWLITNSY
jgi:hypothetical protein